MILALISPVVLAQDGPAPDPEIQRRLAEVSNASLPLDYRSLVARELLHEGDPEGLGGLGSLLEDGEAPVDLRLALVSVALGDPELALFGEVLAAVASLPEESSEEIALRFFRAGSPALAKALSAEAVDAKGGPDDRLLAVRLLGLMGGSPAVPELIALWRDGDAPVAGLARDGLYGVIPVHFSTAEEAAKFWEEHGKMPLTRILWEIGRKKDDGEQSGESRRRLVAFARALLGQASLTNLLEDYLGSSLFELRQMGAEALAGLKYERENGVEGEAEKRAAAVVLAALTAEKDPRAETALLAALGVLAEWARVVDADRTLAAATSRLDRSDAKVRLAALAALRAIDDPRSVEGLRRRYDALGMRDPAYRLAILDTIEQLGNGIAGWVHDKLKVGDPDEAVVRRLLQLLKNYPKFAEPVPTLAGLLQSSKSANIRQEVASTLGIIGVTSGISEAIRALAAHGLSDEDPSVRVIAATQLGRAPKLDDDAIGLLRARLGEVETVLRVRAAVARTVLRHRGAATVTDLRAYLADDEFWRDAVRGYLTGEVLAQGRASDAADLVTALSDVAAWARCAEAARLTLAKELKWEGPAEGRQGEVTFHLVTALAEQGKVEEAVAGLPKVPANLAFDPSGVERLLLVARVRLIAGEPEKSVVALQPIFRIEKPPAGAVARATLALARAQAALGRHAAALKTLAPVLEDATHGADARKLAEEIRAGKSEAARNGSGAAARLVADLDGADPKKATDAKAALKTLGKAAHQPLLDWVGRKPPQQVPAALNAIREITGRTVPYDPAAPEPERRQALEDLKKLLLP